MIHEGIFRCIGLLAFLTGFTLVVRYLCRFSAVDVVKRSHEAKKRQPDNAD